MTPRAPCLGEGVGQQDYLVRMHSFTSSSKHSINFNQMLEECQILLSVQETILEVQEVKLVEEPVCDPYSFDGRDLSVELEELHTRLAGVEDERTNEARKLPKLVMEVSNALVSFLEQQ
jgi:hypothetical protein